MTEALRGRPGLAPSRPAVAHPAADPVAKPVAARRATEARRPYHVGVFLGLSAGVYAVSLAGVTALQSASEQAVAAAHAPAVAALQAASAGNDDLQRRIAAAGDGYKAAAGGYQRAADTLGALESELGALSTSVGKVTGVTSALPNHVALPSLPKMGPVTTVAPAVHATTTASGAPIP